MGGLNFVKDTYESCFFFCENLTKICDIYGDVLINKCPRAGLKNLPMVILTCLVVFKVWVASFIFIKEEFFRNVLKRDALNISEIYISVTRSMLKNLTTISHPICFLS